MADFQASPENLLKQIIRSYRCSVCRRGFQHSPIRIAAKQDELWIVSVRCSRCRKQEVFCVSMKNEDEEGAVGDLSAAEVELFATLPAINSDEILDMHQFLDGFDGNFHRLFEDQSF